MFRGCLGVFQAGRRKPEPVNGLLKEGQPFLAVVNESGDAQGSSAGQGRAPLAGQSQFFQSQRLRFLFPVQLMQTQRGLGLPRQDRGVLPTGRDEGLSRGQYSLKGVSRLRPQAQQAGTAQQQVMDEACERKRLAFDSPVQRLLGLVQAALLNEDVGQERAEEQAVQADAGSLDSVNGFAGIGFRFGQGALANRASAR